MKTTDEEKRQRLLAGLIDGELNPDEAQEANTLLTRSPDFRREYEEQLETAEQLAQLSTIEPQDVIIERIWGKPVHRFTRWAGVWMILGGYAVLLLYVIWKLLINSGEEIVISIATAAVLIGSLIVLVSLVAERLSTWKSDPYKDVKR